MDKIGWNLFPGVATVGSFISMKNFLHPSQDTKSNSFRIQISMLIIIRSICYYERKLCGCDCRPLPSERVETDNNIMGALTVASNGFPNLMLYKKKGL
jgi:hypothetical protein